MSKLSLAGAWKLRGEFMDVTAERYNEVLRKMDAAPVRATLPAFLKLEDLSEEEQAEFLKDPNPHFHVMTDKANHAFPSKYGFIPMTVPGDVTTALIENGIAEEPFLKENTKKNQWIKDLSWWLVRDFDVTEEMLNEDIVRLNIEMLDFNADIIVNGHARCAPRKRVLRVQRRHQALFARRQKPARHSPHLRHGAALSARRRFVLLRK